MTATGKLNSLLPHLAVIASVVILGLSFVAIRAIVAERGAPGTLGVLRYSLAALALVPFLLPNRRWRLPIRVAGIMLILGAVQFGLFQIFLNTALQEIAASRGAVIFALIPILTMLIASAAGRDSLTTIKIAGALLSFIGVALAIGEKAIAAEQSDSWRGEILFFFAVSCGATYNAFSARILRDHDFVPLTALAMAAGAVVLMSIAAFENPLTTVQTYNLANWLWLAYLALPAGAIGFLLFNYGLRNLQPSQAAIWVPLSPISAAFFGAVLLGEDLSWLFLIGLACAVCGPLIVNWRR